MPVEVKSGNPKVPPRAFISFIDRYDVGASIVITEADWKTEEFNRCTVHFIPAPLLALRGV